jgi:DNA-binding transcriptional ArsR family regulator
MGELTPRLAEDQFYRALASPHRRRLLYYLSENGESTVEDLTSVLSGWEATTTGTMHTSSDRSEILSQLLHNHLPRLADARLIDYDAHAGTVQLEPLHPRTTEVIRQSVQAEQLVDSE